MEHPRDHSLTPPRYRAFSGPVGSGKTMTVCDHLLHLAHQNKGCTGLLGSATYPLLRDSAQKTLFERMHHHNIPFRYLKSENRIFLPKPQTHILCRSLDDYDRLRGTNLAFFGVDELTYCHQESWLQLEARLRDPKAVEKVGCASFTPRGFDWVYRRFIKDPLPEYAAIRARPFENHFLGESYYRGLLNSYSPEFARQEVLGEYLNLFEGRVYSSFEQSPGGNVWRAGEINHVGSAPCVYWQDRPLLWALDFNVSPATSVICQSVPQRRDIQLGSTVAGMSPRDKDHVQLNVLDEIYLQNINTYQHVEAFWKKIEHKLLPYPFRVPIIVYGDASGSRRQSSASHSDYQIIAEFFERRKDRVDVEFRVPNANPQVIDRVNSVNAMCHTYTGNRRLLVHERCKELIRDLDEVSYAKDSNNNLLPALSTKDPARTHISDALGYLIYEEFGIRSSVGER